METVRIVLTCPECGSTKWFDNDDGAFCCAVCGTDCYPEAMKILKEATPQ